MLRDEVEQYTKLTGEDGWRVPIIKGGAYLDGYNKGLETLDKIRAEIEKKHARAKQMNCVLQMNAYTDCLQIIDKYKESEDKE